MCWCARFHLAQYSNVGVRLHAKGHPPQDLNLRHKRHGGVKADSPSGRRTHVWSCRVGETHALTLTHVWSCRVGETHALELHAASQRGSGRDAFQQGDLVLGLSGGVGWGQHARMSSCWNAQDGTLRKIMSHSSLSLTCDMYTAVSYFNATIDMNKA